MRKAFTLVEIMIVVLIIGILLSIAVPQWMRARENSRSKQCIATLKQIDGAKEFYAIQNSLGNGSPVTMGDLWPAYINQSTPPTCTGGGTIAVNVIGTNPTCTYNFAPFPHVLP
jgi:prepilin-type N-terminal cleavage/methylation domain-containing protein